MSSVSKQHALVFDDVETMLAMNPNLSLDELNVALQHKVQDRNNQPHSIFVAWRQRKWPIGFMRLLIN